MNYIDITKPSCIIKQKSPTDVENIHSYLYGNLLQEDLTELHRRRILTLDDNKTSLFQYQIEDHISGHLLTGFSAKLTNYLHRPTLKKTVYSGLSVITDLIPRDGSIGTSHISSKTVPSGHIPHSGSIGASQLSLKTVHLVLSQELGDLMRQSKFLPSGKQHYTLALGLFLQYKLNSRTKENSYHFLKTIIH